MNKEFQLWSQVQQQTLNRIYFYSITLKLIYQLRCHPKLLYFFILSHVFFINIIDIVNNIIKFWTNCISHNSSNMKDRSLLSFFTFLWSLICVFKFISKYNFQNYTHLHGLQQTFNGFKVTFNHLLHSLLIISVGFFVFHTLINVSIYSFLSDFDSRHISL